MKINSGNVYSARKIASDCCLKDNETIMGIYPTNKIPKEEITL